MRTILLAAVAVALLSSTTPAHAWNGRGHMIVADIAWRILSPQSRASVAKLLKLNPDYDTWVENIPLPAQDEIAFMRAAMWADDIKSKPDYTRGPKHEPGAAENIGYSDKKQHRYWHFKDIPFTTDGTPLEQFELPNAETQILMLRQQLGSPIPDELKSYALVWLIHLVGDAHQPLHATTRFSQSPPNLQHGDRGGNEITVCPASACGKNLHAYWDDLLGVDKTPAKVMVAAAGWQLAPTTSASNVDVASWFRDSFEKSKSDVYTGPIGNGAGPYPLTPDYKRNAKAVATKQVAIAGVRLAVLIENALQRRM